MKKITLATIKRFVAREQKNNNLYVQSKSTFDGMQDCVAATGKDFEKATSETTPRENNLGINGIWLVLSSRDYFEPYADSNYLGYSVSNSCGSFIVAMKRLI